VCLLASFSGEDQGGAEKLFVAQQIRRPDLASLTVHVRRHRMTQELHDGMACIVRGMEAARSQIRGPCVSLRIIGRGWVLYVEALSLTD
jgi:hypothetical protein